MLFNIKSLSHIFAFFNLVSKKLKTFINFLIFCLRLACEINKCILSVNPQLQDGIDDGLRQPTPPPKSSHKKRHSFNEEVKILFIDVIIKMK